jgi:hypothetical protein
MHSYELTTDGYAFFNECIAVARDSIVSIRVRTEAAAFEASLPYSDSVLDHMEDFTRALAGFLAEQCVSVSNRRYAQEIGQLRLRSIDFSHRRPFDVAEVVFAETAPGRVWWCDYWAGAFHHLGLDPRDSPRPTGPFKFRTGNEYCEARSAADSSNRVLHQSDPAAVGKLIHEIHPVKFNGSPTDHANKVYVDRIAHPKYSSWWCRRLHDLEPDIPRTGPGLASSAG